MMLFLSFTFPTTGQVEDEERAAEGFLGRTGRSSLFWKGRRSSFLFCAAGEEN